MDQTLSSLAPLLSEKVGVAALFALAIYAGVVVLRLWITTNREVELARIAVQQTMAAALQSQAGAAATLAQSQADVRRVSEEQAIVLRLISQRIGLGWSGAADVTRAESKHD